MRVLHPFPSGLNAVAAAVIAAIAGAEPILALRLGLAMLLLQFAIGIANDLADTRADAISKPRKPIPAGLVSRRTALVGFLVASAAGLGVAASVGAAAAVVGLLGLADGLLYDLRLKGTGLGWLPFAAGVGLLPLYSWIGAGAALSPGFAVVFVLAVAAGTALALANAFADLQRDGLSGTVSVATVLGARTTLRVDAAILATVQIVALAMTFSAAGPSLALAAEVVGSLVGWIGVCVGVVGRGRASHLVWELQGIGIVLVGAAWLSAMSSAGVLQR